MTARLIWGYYGVTYDDIKSWGGSVTLVDSANVIAMLKDNRADMTIDHSTPAQANYVELTLTTKVFFAKWDEKVLAMMNQKGYAYNVMKKGTYNNSVTEDLQSVGSPMAVLVHASVSDDIAYIMTKAICEHKKELLLVDANFAPFDPETAWEPAKAGCELHPGSIKYYRERGWMK